MHGRTSGCRAGRRQTTSPSRHRGGQLTSQPPNSFCSITLPHSSDNVAPDPRLVAPQAEGALGIHQLDPTRLHASALLAPLTTLGEDSHALPLPQLAAVEGAVHVASA